LDEDHLPPGQTVVPVGDEVVVDDDTMRRALEAILMVTDEPLPVLTLARAVGRPTGDVAAALTTLAEEYTDQGRGFDLREVGGGWRYYTRVEAAPYVERFILDGQQARLTQAALETLSVVAYKQPVSRARVSAIRGVNVDGVMRTLIARGLVEEAGADTESQATLYRTTSYFLERMGMQSLDDLPELAPYLPDMDDIEEELAAQTLPPPPEAPGTTNSDAADSTAEAQHTPDNSDTGIDADLTTPDNPADPEAETEAATAEPQPIEHEPIEHEPIEHEPTELDPADHDSSQPEPAENESAELDPADHDSSQDEPAEHESAELEPAEHEPSQAELAENESAELEPAEHEASQAELAEQEPIRSEPGEHELGELEPNEPELVEPESGEMFVADVPAHGSDHSETGIDGDLSTGDGSADLDTAGERGQSHGG
jgi:segregation and condensation protein B